MVELLFPHEPEYIEGGCSQGKCCLPAMYRATDDEGIIYDFSMSEIPDVKTLNLEKAVNSLSKSLMRSPKRRLIQTEPLYKNSLASTSPVGYTVEFLTNGNHYSRITFLVGERFFYSFGTDISNDIYQDIEIGINDDADLEIIKYHTLKTQAFIESILINGESPFGE